MKKVTYCGTVMPNNKGLPSVLKYVKNGKLNSSLYMWKKDSPP